MNKILPLIVAMILAVGAVIGIHNYMKKRDVEFKKKTRPKKVIVAGRKMKTGERLTSDILMIREFPAKMLPENVVTGQDLKDIINQPVNRDVYPGEALLWTSIGAKRTEQSFSQIIPANERALTIPFDKIDGVDGYIQPNDRVDMYMIADVPTKNQKKITTEEGRVIDVEVEEMKKAAFLLLQNVTVMATGDSFAKGAVGIKQNYSSITISVTPEEAGLLKYAIYEGQLSLTLRNPKDFSENEKIEIYNMDSILDVAKLKSVQNKRTNRIEIYRKGKVDVIER